MQAWLHACLDTCIAGFVHFSASSFIRVQFYAQLASHISSVLQVWLYVCLGSRIHDLMQAQVNVCLALDRVDSLFSPHSQYHLGLGEAPETALPKRLLIAL